MEVVLTVLAWGVQIGITVGIALVIGWIWKLAEEAIRRKAVRLIPRVLIVLALLCVLLAGLAVNPPVVCHEEYEDELTPEIVSAVQSVGRGLYSKNLPLVPACVEITKIDKTEAYSVSFRVNYLYFARVRYSWSSEHGYNRESQWMN